MASITVLGAGYMGSALASVACKRGHRVRLWGTWLDDDLITAMRQGLDHPRLKLKLDSRIETFFHAQLAEALVSADAVVCGVNSEGVQPVFEKALNHVPPSIPILSVTKGFLKSEEGSIQRISQILQNRFFNPSGRNHPWIAIGGPCKAMEVARNVRTGVVYAGVDSKIVEMCASWLETDTYSICRTDDLAGVETCSAFKNAYATASGLCDGLQALGHPEMHNTRAMLFAQACQEITKMVVAMGGRPETAQGLAGVGDLHVTAAAGRNRAFGERVGRGGRPEQVAAQMASANELTEGYWALKTGRELLEQLDQRGRLSMFEFPLLCTLYRIVYQDRDVSRELAALRC